MAEHGDEHQQQSSISSLRLPYLSDLNNSCAGKAVVMGAAGFFTGSLWGACSVAFQDIPLKSVSARTATLHSFRQVGQHGVLFGSVSSIFFAADCVASSMAGGTGLISSAAGGLAAGLFLLARTGNHRFALQCGSGLAAISELSVLVDMVTEDQSSPRNVARLQRLQDKRDALPQGRAGTPLFDRVVPPPTFLRVDEAE